MQIYIITLINFFIQKKHYICFILLNEFHHVHQGCYTGKNYKISLTDSIKHKEQNDITKIKTMIFE